MKFDMANGTMNGEDTTCKKSDRHCTHLYTYHHDRRDYRDRYLTRMNFHNAPKYGEWADLTATITFPANELAANNTYLTLLLYYVGKLIEFSDIIRLAYTTDLIKIVFLTVMKHLYIDLLGII